MRGHITIRKAENRDLGHVVALAKMMAEYHHELDPYYKSGSSYKNLELDLAEELEDKDSNILVAETEKQIVGYFRGMIEPGPMYIAAKKIGVVNDLVVRPDFRRKTVGQQLFTAAREWFASRNVKNIELNVDSRNEPGVKFWRKNGFFDYKIRMRLDLKEE